MEYTPKPAAATRTSSKTTPAVRPNLCCFAAAATELPDGWTCSVCAGAAARVAPDTAAALADGCDALEAAAAAWEPLRIPEVESRFTRCKSARISAAD